MNTGVNITRTDLRPARRAALKYPPTGARPAAYPLAMFIAELLARGDRNVVHDQFRGACPESQLAAIGEPLVVRTDRDCNELEALVRLNTGELALLDGGHGQLSIEVAATSRERALAAAASLRRTFELEPPVEDRVSIAFWMRGEYGGSVRHREIDAPSFEQISANYAAGVREALERLLVIKAPDRGRLILWRGEPGTGKSHALRALARAWRSWCSAHFVIDPEEFLGAAGAYMLDVLSWDGDDDDRWRLLILEDAGELIAGDARAQAGQALSRLLNIADGLLGQGTRTLLLITTNEPVRRLHPATRRPGRCLADVEFTPLSVAEANAWLERHSRSERVERPLPLAELFGRTDGEPVHAESDTPTGFGFARALEQTT